MPRVCPSQAAEAPRPSPGPAAEARRAAKGTAKPVITKTSDSIRAVALRKVFILYILLFISLQKFGFYRLCFGRSDAEASSLRRRQPRFVLLPSGALLFLPKQQTAYVGKTIVSCYCYFPFLLPLAKRLPFLEMIT